MVGIFLLLQACLRSWRLALLAFLALPASIAGGVLAALVSGGVTSLGSLVGFLALLGIAARNGLLLVNHYLRLEQDGMPFGLDLVLRGVRERLAPILASSAAIIAALLPMIVFGSIPGLEIVQPMAIVMIGGLAASTLFTLFVLPALYLVLGPGDRSDTGIGLARG
jgi:Cu/Ag efflux pump CusA